MMTSNKNLAILVAGGPAPGINSVIGAATIRGRLEGAGVLGVRDGFKWIMRGDISHIEPLSITKVSRIHFRGGSYIGIARDNPTREARQLQDVVTSLLRLNVDKLITIGGDDTAFSAMKVEELAAGRIRVVHVPKTIDNDLDLPHGICTFGFQTARHHGVNIVKHLMVDARTTSRWYFIVSMGRKAGHLALGIGKAAGSTLTLIPEELPPGRVRLARIVDVLVGAIIKRLSYGHSDGVAVLAEGLVERLDPEELSVLIDTERDEHDNIRLAEINFGEILKYHVQKELAKFDLKTTIVAKNIGYELRCADPIPFDLEYTRDLGFSAADYLLRGGNAAMISIQDNRFVPIPFSEILDPMTGRTRVRMVEVHSESYRIALRYMLRLSDRDFEDPHELAKYAATAGITVEQFRERFAAIAAADVWEVPELEPSGNDVAEDWRAKQVERAHVKAREGE